MSERQGMITTDNVPKRIVNGDGPSSATIMIVGDAPGSQEEMRGKPFIGAAGDILNACLERAGIIRSNCYITNVVKERPPMGNIDTLISFTKGVKKSAVYDTYEKSLYAEIDRIKPNVIVAMGSVALYAVTRKTSVMKYRGSILPSCSDIPGYKVIPVIHPSAALRQYLLQHMIANDLRRVREHSKSREIVYKNREYILNPSFDDSLRFLSDCMGYSRVAFDIEVSNMEVSCISFAYSDNLAISIPFVHNGNDYFTPLQEAEIWRRIALILENENIEALGQNTTFDTTFLFNKYGIKTKNIQDTMVAQAILYPDYPKGLDFITSMYTDIPYYKDEGKHRIVHGGGSDESFWLYNAKDSIVLIEAFPKQLAALTAQGNLDTYRNQVKLIEPLLYMTQRGMKMDYEGLEKASKDAEKRLLELEIELEKICGERINLASPKQLGDYFYKKLGIKPYLKGGNPTTDEGALKRLSRRGYKEAEIIMEHRTLAKLNGTYFKMKLDEDKRLRTAMNPVGTRTGRLSSSQTIFGTGANVQNQPPIMKKFMLCDEGYVAYEVDLGQAENRVVAYLGPDLKMIDAFESGADIHRRTASLIFGVPEGEISDEAGSSDIAGGQYSQRFWGKKANHSLNYGMGYKKFAYTLEIAENEGKFIVDRYHQGYPGVRQMHAWIVNQLRKDRTLTNLFGRRYIFLDRWDDTLMTDAYAFMPQSSIADKVNRHGLMFVYYSQDIFKHVEILNQVHDSILFQIPLTQDWEYHASCLLALKKNLEQPMHFRGRDFSIPADMKMLPKNMKDGINLKRVPEDVTEFATILKESYEKASNR